MASPRVKVVVLGGGTGCPTVLRALRLYAVDLTAIVTTFDSGGSTGRLREELGVPAFGDLRRCLGALASPDEPHAMLANLWEHRFPGDGSLAGHTLGNLALAALYQKHGGLEAAIESASSLLNVQGSVLPVALHQATLCARLQDGTTIRSEERIDHLPDNSSPVADIFLDPPVGINPRALKALLEAQVIILGPGDLYTSVLPNVLVQGLSEAITASPAQSLYICNVTNRMGPTTGFTASKYAREVLRYLKATSLGAILVNQPAIPLPATTSEEAVPLDREACQALARTLLVADIAAADGHRHDERRLGKILWQFCTG
ncbi:MAG: YvcK family protein [Dehalococcoidia bacterium]|nr:YvcK family protein [Dehalococcoidia bacterium]